jgi:hypothetical protein
VLELDTFDLAHERARFLAEQLRPKVLHPALALHLLHRQLESALSCSALAPFSLARRSASRPMEKDTAGRLGAAIVARAKSYSD